MERSQNIEHKTANPRSISRPNFAASRRSPYSKRRIKISSTIRLRGEYLQPLHGDAVKTPKSKTSLKLLLTLLLLLSLGITAVVGYRESRQQKLDSALFIALKQKDPVMVKAHLAEGADPNARDVQLDKRLLWVRLWDRIQGKPLSIEEEPTALWVALGANGTGESQAQNAAMISTLLDAGAAIDAKVINGSTVLFHAVEAGDVAAVNLLIARGARANVKNNDGKTPLHWAAYNDVTEVARLLLEKGSDVNARDSGGDTPLCSAILYNQEALVKLLLARGAQVNVKDNADYTPLLFAKQNHQPGILKLLKEAGAAE
ncbi:MAG: hypothetical protein JWN14_3113 [Chthonomonadales bacterium]|nr:hypothetical protein [Chthonomonadales bacterium]